MDNHQLRHRRYSVDQPRQTGPNMVKLSLPESELTLWPLGQPRLTAADNAGELPGCELPALTMSLANPTPLGMPLPNSTPSKRPTQTVIVRQRLDVRRELNGSAPP